MVRWVGHVDSKRLPIDAYQQRSVSKRTVSKYLAVPPPHVAAMRPATRNRQYSLTVALPGCSCPPIFLPVLQPEVMGRKIGRQEHESFVSVRSFCARCVSNLVLDKTKKKDFEQIARSPYCRKAVRKEGFEPTPLSGPDPKSGASANSATPAKLNSAITYAAADFLHCDCLTPD